MRPVRILLLDADGVIQAPAAGWRDAVAALCGDAAKVEPFLEALFAAERPCLRGDGDFAEALGEVLARWQCRTTVTEALELWTRIEPREDLLRLVDALRAGGIRVGLATNQQAHRAAHMTQVLGGEVLFVDDHASNVAAARESGFNAEVFEPSTGVKGMHTLLAPYGLAGVAR